MYFSQFWLHQQSFSSGLKLSELAVTYNYNQTLIIFWSEE